MTAFSLITNWLLFGSLTIAMGTAAGRWWILPSGWSPAGPEPDDLRSLMARTGRWASAVVGAALVLVFVRQLIEFRDPFSPWSDEAVLLLRGTPWGRIWSWGVAGGLVLAMGFRGAARRRSWGWPVATVAALAMGAFPAFTGHANAGDLRAVTLVADTVHVWAVGAWMGGLTIVLLLEHRYRASDSTAGSLLPVLVPRFSPLAMGSVGALATTGVVAAWVHLDGIAALYTSAYGRLLVLKLLLVGGVLALGARNFRRLSPRLGEEDEQAALRRSAAMEITIAALVLAITAVLVRTSPM